jgi:hypothetical protein
LVETRDGDRTSHELAVRPGLLSKIPMHASIRSVSLSGCLSQTDSAFSLSGCPSLCASRSLLARDFVGASDGEGVERFDAVDKNDAHRTGGLEKMGELCEKF